MDIRVKKTKRAIQKAFVALLREKPIEKITVKEIAERAEINKTTFYSHYETLDALTAEMERQTVQLVCDNMGGAQQLLDTPEAFVREMFANLQQATDYLGVVPASAMNALHSICGMPFWNRSKAITSSLLNMKMSVRS